MFILKRLQGLRFSRFNSVIDKLQYHLTNTIDLIGSATLPLPEICQAISLPGNAVRVEGHIGSRYFPRSDPIDEAEFLAEEGLRNLFRLDKEYSVSVQPHSATQANHMVWNSILKRGDKVIGLSLSDGGHISHSLGLPEGVTFESFPISKYGIDYERLQKLCQSLKPKMIIGGASSYPLEINYPRLSEISTQIEAHLHADIAHTAPYVIAGLHQNVVPYSDSITIDTGKNLRGPKGGILVYRTSLQKKLKRSIFPLIQSSPNQSGILAKACLFQYWGAKEIHCYAEKLIDNAKTLSDTLTKNGLKVVFGETQTHIILVDVGVLGYSGKEAEAKLEQLKILTNRNTIPGETRAPWEGSGLRIGTTVLTILGYSNFDIRSLGELISNVLNSRSFDSSIVDELLKKYHHSIVGDF